MPTRLHVIIAVCSLFCLVAAQAPSTQPVVVPSTAAPTTRPGNRSAEDTLRQMLQPQGAAARPLTPVQDAPPAVDETSGSGAVMPNAPAQKLMREGTLLLDRLGRLQKSADGGFEFVLDADGRGMADPPLKLMPNRKLMQLEDRVQSSYRDLPVRVTGEVTEYRGRNYLLLQRWSAVADVTQPLQ
jgi:hypothetical protein